MGNVALVEESESAFREEGWPEVLCYPMLHMFAGDRHQRLIDHCRSQSSNKGTERGQETRKTAFVEIAFERLQFTQRRFERLAAPGKAFAAASDAVSSAMNVNS